MAGLALLALVVACFSDRSGVIGPSAGACNANLDPSQFGSTIIAIRGFSFQPTPVHVKAGNKVTWLNCEPAGTPSHTSTSDGGVWGSTLIDPGLTFTFLFATPGRFAYHCEPHPSMTAQIVVDP
jgi:plastocyanin